MRAGQMLHISFLPLQEQHLSLLLEWLEQPHVKAWWDQDVHWTPELVIEKYGSYIEGYKLENGERKPMQAYIACLDNRPVAYIQLYNAHDFPREDGASLQDLPQSLAAIDIFMGEPAFVGKGYGSGIMKSFLKDHVAPHYEACFVDPDRYNTQAVRAYEKAGFVPHKSHGDSIWMLWRKS